MRLDEKPMHNRLITISGRIGAETKGAARTDFAGEKLYDARFFPDRLVRVRS